MYSRAYDCYNNLPSDLEKVFVQLEMCFLRKWFC